MDRRIERTFLAVAHALFMNRLHLLRLTEIVRLGVRPDRETGFMDIPQKLDGEMKQAAIDYIFACFPSDLHPAINSAKAGWLTPA